MSAIGKKVLDLAEQQGLLDVKAIAELRRQVAESKFVVTPEAIAKVLVDHGHLTPFQARKLVSQAMGNQPDPVEQRLAEKKPQQRSEPEEELTLADSETDIPIRARPAQKKDEAAPELERPVEGSTAEDFVPLKPAKVNRPPRGTRWKTDQPGSLSETIEMAPIDLGSSQPPPAPIQAPIDDLFGPDPFGKPAFAPAPSRPPQAAAPQSAAPLDDLFGPAPLSPAPLQAQLKPLAPPKKNVWDSPFLLIGGGALGVMLVVFLLLLYLLTRGSAAELFAKAEEEYRNGSFATALGIYEKFLKDYPDDPNASLARVRRGMATLRQVSDEGKSPRQALETAKEVLPQIEKEEKFAEARDELATILPDIAEGFATQAGQVSETVKKEELVRLAGEALALVNNPSYVPASLRKEREGRIARTIDKLKAAERSIQQNKDLAAAVEKINTSAEKGNASSAYQVQADLIKVYPALEANPQLVAAIQQVGAKERQLVSVSSGGPAPLTTDHSLGSQRVVLTFREGSGAKSASNAPAFLLLEGAVYGVSPVSGEVLWRRYVGHETTARPLAVAADGSTDAIVIDGRRRELLRLKGGSGELVWRQMLGEPALGPVLAGERVLVATRKGRILAIDAASGEIAASAQLPQGVSVAPAVGKSRILQLGEHSTLFVLDAKSLVCTETVYLGHKAGAVIVPPVAVLDQLLFVESPMDDASLIQVLALDAKTNRFAAVGKPLRLKGRIVTPLAVSGARVAAITDLAQCNVYEVDSTSPERIRLLAGLEASETTPRTAFCALDRNRLWVSNRRRTLYDVQAALSQLKRGWTENQDDSFITPLQVHGETIVQIRRRSDVAGALIEGASAAGGEIQWTTHGAAPVIALIAGEAGRSAVALTAEGRLYSLGDAAFASNQVLQPSFSSTASGATIFSDAPLSADGQRLTWTQQGSGGRAFVYDATSGGQPVSISLPGRAAAAAAPLGSGVVAPLTDGSVAYLPRDSSEAKVAPFMPPLTPDSLPLWTRPAPMADGKSFVISDGRSTVYRITQREGQRPQLAQVGEATSTWPITRQLAMAGSIAICVLQQEKSDAIAGFGPGPTGLEPVQLEGRVEAGPFAVGGLAFVAGEPDGLVCIGGDGKIRWRQPLEHGPIAASPVAAPDGDLIVAYQSGEVCRVDAASGKELASHDVGEPLQGAACIVGSNLVVTGSDGVVHRVAIPPRR